MSTSRNGSCWIHRLDRRGALSQGNVVLLVWPIVTCASVLARRARGGPVGRGKQRTGGAAAGDDRFPTSRSWSSGCNGYGGSDCGFGRRLVAEGRGQAPATAMARFDGIKHAKTNAVEEKLDDVTVAAAGEAYLV